MFRVVINTHRFLSAYLCLASIGTATAAPCPDTPEASHWVRGRLMVRAANLGPDEIRGVGEVYVYAYKKSTSSQGSAYWTMSDNNGDFCLENTAQGSWVVTVFEPFHFRPFVREVDSVLSTCHMGNIFLDSSMLTISDDYVEGSYREWGGPALQSVVLPENTVAMIKVTFRSAAFGQNYVELYEGEGATLSSMSLLGTSSLQFPEPYGGRGTAVFQAGGLPGVPGNAYTVLLAGESAPYRLTDNAYSQGQMYDLSGENLVARTNEDLCLHLDLDGPDLNRTSYLVLGSDGYEWGHTFVQTFVARSEEITHMSISVGTPEGARRILASVHETLQDANAGTNPVSSVKEMEAWPQQTVAFAWFVGEQPVTPNHTYYARFYVPREDGQALYTHKKDSLGSDLVSSGGPLYVDGVQVQGYAWGRIMGLITHPAVSDNDQDGYNAIADCDDNNAAINPGAGEICSNGVDENCDGVDVGCDNDEDGYALPEDCDDNDANIHPGADEICDNTIDEDCDGTAEACDFDQDGYDPDVDDCNDLDPIIHPGATDPCGDGVDQDCDGSDALCTGAEVSFAYEPRVPEPLETVVITVAGHTGYINIGLAINGTQGPVEPSLVTIVGGCGAPDTPACRWIYSAVFPEAGTYSVSFFADPDHTVYGSDTLTVVAGDTADGDKDGFRPPHDCKDNDPNIHPGQSEICGNDVDEDCDGIDSDCDDDADGDTYVPPADCDDTNAKIHPGATEICGNDVDEDCDGVAEKCAEDKDKDGYETPADCDDTNPNIHPGAAEICGNDVDEDCIGGDADCEEDQDGDTYVPPYDCNDANPDIHPGAEEICGNEVDENCDDIIEVCENTPIQSLPPAPQSGCACTGVTGSLESTNHAGWLFGWLLVLPRLRRHTKKRPPKPS